jgi:AbrB family looped-hinge helix DNA binding protein
MTTDNAQSSRSALPQTGVACCGVEAIVSVDERGQMVLPKELRERAGIRAGDKLALVSWQQSGAVCCLALIKVDDLAAMVKAMLGPIVKQVFEE